MNKVLKKVKQGVTLYVVWTYYPYCAEKYQSDVRSRCTVEEVHCMGRVTVDDRGDYSFYGYSEGLSLSEWGLKNGMQKYLGGILCKMYFPQDMGLVINEYRKQYHRTFFSKKKALRYVDLVKSGCNI